MTGDAEGPIPNAERYRFGDFTLENFRTLVRLARDRFEFRPFSAADTVGRVVLWRHDVDMSLDAARRLARIEAEEGVAATYFLLLHSEFYNPLERDMASCAREILGLGHAIGLHFDPAFYEVRDERGLEDALGFERSILERVFGAPIGAFSFHNPGSQSDAFRAIEYAGLVNAYSESLRTRFTYCSDSNGYWRFARLEDVLTDARVERLHALTHPEWWTDEVMSPSQRVRRCVSGRAAKTLADYERLLAAFGRSNIDWE